MLWLQILNGFPCAFVTSFWKCFQHTINWGVRSGRLGVAEGWMEASSPLSPTISDKNFSVFWTLVSHKTRSKWIPDRNALFLLPEFRQFLLFTAFYYLLHHCCWVSWVTRYAEKESIKSVENPNTSFFVLNLEHSCILQSQRSRSWAREEEIWTWQTPRAPSQIHAHGSNQWKWWKVWRRDTGIFLEIGGQGGIAHGM